MGWQMPDLWREATCGTKGRHGYERNVREPVQEVQRAAKTDAAAEDLI